MQLRLALGLALWLAAPATAQVASAPASQAPATLPATQALVETYVRDGKIPGGIVTLGRRGQPPMYAGAGTIAFDAGAAKVDENSLWRVYSMTKPVTGIAAMILVEEGKLRLDQPISDFIPGFKSMKVLDTPDGGDGTTHPAKTAITVRHLLTHTAGLGYDLGQSAAAKGSLLELYRTNGINPAQVSAALEPTLRRTRPASLEAFANKLATLPLMAEPGTKWSYSIGLDLLGRVIEVAGGMPFDKFLETRIFHPLGMHSTYFTVPAGDANRLATNYLLANGGRVPLDTGAGSAWLNPPSFPYGGAGLISTAHDYDRFLAMLQNEGTLDGVRVLKPETARLAMSNLLPAGADTSALGALSGLGAKLGFGAGGSVYLVDVPGGPGKGTYGWAGAAGTIAWVDPTRGVRGSIMVNFFPGELYPLRAEATKAIYTDLHHP